MEKSFCWGMIFAWDLRTVNEETRRLPPNLSTDKSSIFCIWGFLSSISMGMRLLLLCLLQRIRLPLKVGTRISSKSHYLLHLFSSSSVSLAQHVGMLKWSFRLVACWNDHLGQGPILQLKAIFQTFNYLKWISFVLDGKNKNDYKLIKHKSTP